MDSKMRPLWLVFQNQDGLGDDVLQIFKNGDGEIEQIYATNTHSRTCMHRPTLVHVVP